MNHQLLLKLDIAFIETPASHPTIEQLYPFPNNPNIHWKQITIQGTNPNNPRNIYETYYEEYKALRKNKH